MDLIQFATYVIQELTNEREGYESSLLEAPITDPLKANADAGYARGLKRSEAVMRKMIKDLESGNYKPPLITINPIESLFQADTYILQKKGQQ